MTTQSLRGMANRGSMHWRGDRTGGNDPDSDAFDEVRAFLKFNPAFPGLLGRDAELSEAEMQAFADFILTVTYPPNPIRALDMSLAAVSKHLQTLERAGLVRRHRQGREHTLSLDARPLRQVVRWTSRYERFWNEQLDRLEAYFAKKGPSK